MGHPDLCQLKDRLAEVGVVFVDPVLARRGEDVEVDGVFESFGGVREIAGDDEDFARVDDVGDAVAQDEAKGTLEDEGELLVGVGVGGDDAAFGEDDAGEHGLCSGDELAREQGIKLLVFYFAPSVKGGGHGMGLSVWMRFFSFVLQGHLV